MPPPVKHHSKSKVGRRRSHLALVSPKLLVCPNCAHPVLPHRFCSNCGEHKGKVVKPKSNR
ncbi:50S ribosomal protein L32 [Candidatus Wolfebacteria bacterium]|nr:50S ribosomal protein L32 [Candidatus Wolfebacteria bacterium]